MKYLFASLLICLSVTVHAQQHHFMYIQADNRQPFYIKLEKKILSSSASGYLIIPQLLDSSYELSIGFPKNEWPEQKVTCSIDKKDVGYLLKNFGEKGWGLFNFQTMDLVMAETKTNADSSMAKVKNDDPFSNALANVVNDPNIKVKEVEEDSAIVIAPVKKAPVKKDVKAVAKSKTKDWADAKNKEHIAKLLSKHNAEGLKMVYVDKANGSVDTINIVIPIEKPVVKVIPAKADTAAVSKHIVSNKKPVKKTVVSKADIAKANKKIADKLNDSLALVSTPVKTEETKPGIVLENKDLVNSIDTASTVVQPSKKLEDIIADIAKDSTRKVNEDAMLAAEKKRSEDEAALAAATNKANEEAALAAEKKKAQDEAAIVAEKKKNEEEAGLAAEKKKVEDDAALAAEKKKSEDEATLAAEKKKAHDEAAIVAEKKKNEEEAVLAAEKKKVDDDAVLAAEKKKAQDYADSVAQRALVQEKPKEDVILKTNSVSTVPVYACKYVADGDEFMNLRKKMLKGKSDNEMLFIAHQLFLKRCVTTKQIERLSLLFNNDLAKYNLFDDAYHFIADADIFPTLQSQLTDDYYIKRFKAMLRQ